MIPSKYQTAIYDFVGSGTGNAVIEATAGSGKTTTIVDSLKLAHGRILFCAFNRHIVDTLKQRVPEGVEVATLHSIGLRSLSTGISRPKLNEQKVEQIIQAFYSYYDRRAQRAITSSGAKVISLVRATLTDYNSRSALNDLINHYGLDLDSYENDLLADLPKLMAKVNESPEIDFDDMIYRAATDNSSSISRYDFVFVDELQDLNAAQLRLLELLSGNGRVIAVGDRSQSIYGWMGADYEAVPRTIKRLNAKTLPLSITYRCPISHVHLAQTIVPQIEAWDQAQEGEIKSVSPMHLHQYLHPGVLVLCRTNAPLVSGAFSLLQQNIPAMIRGRDIGLSLISLVNKLWNGEAMNSFLANVYEYQGKELARMEARNATESQIQAFKDKIDTLNVLSMNSDTVEDLLDRTQKLFRDDDDRHYVVFSTVHRAKGLEADEVYILKPELMPMRTKQSWEAQQEQNIMYVSYTRSKRLLGFIEGDRI